MPRVAKPKVGRPERTARNDDWTDREMLGIISDVQNESSDGYATTTEIALKMGFTGNGEKGRTPAIKVATRLAWMRDAGGIIESEKPDLTVPYNEPGARDTRWRLTQQGRVILNGQVTKAVSNALEKMDAGSQTALMRELMRAGWIGGTTSTAFAIDRQYKHDRAQRRVIFRPAKNPGK